MIHNKVRHVRSEFFHRKKLDLVSNGTIEIINASFIADEKYIFGEVNYDYTRKELDWYKSQSLNVMDIEKPIPKIWLDIASKQGKINSNYGWCIFSEENFNQFDNAINCLKNNINSRQSSMIYIRPSMHEDAFVDGMKDFICTFAVQLFIRSKRLHYCVFMRSNDAIFGYKNDKHWHDVVHNLALVRLQEEYPDLTMGYMYWNAATLHIYERHFGLIN